VTGLRAAWDRFWFAPTPTSTLALVRIAYASVLLGWCALISFDLTAFFSPSGILPSRVRLPWSWSLLDVFPSDTAVALLFAVLVWAAVFLFVGFHTRLAALVAFVVLLSFERRNLVVFNSADTLLRLFGLYLALAPAGAALSVDRWRAARDRFWEFPLRAPWALRLIQVQVSVMYLFTVWLKVQGETWNQGTAVSYSLRVLEVARFDLPHWLTESAVVSNLLTYGTLAVELALAVLLWNRRARPWVVGAGLLLHVSIQSTIMVGLFSTTVAVGYLAFTEPENAGRWLLAVRDRLRRSRLAPLRRLGSAGPPPDGGSQPELPWPDPVEQKVPSSAAEVPERAPSG
jgi:hypothetical protein